MEILLLMNADPERTWSKADLSQALGVTYYNCDSFLEWARAQEPALVREVQHGATWPRYHGDGAAIRMFIDQIQQEAKDEAKP